MEEFKHFWQDAKRKDPERKLPDITLDQLKALVEVLKEQGGSRMSFGDFFEFIMTTNIQQSAEVTEPSSAPFSQRVDESATTTPGFKFQSPKQPFTPFPSMIQPNEINKDISSGGPFTAAGLFNAQDIPTTIGSPFSAENKSQQSNFAFQRQKQNPEINNSDKNVSAPVPPATTTKVEEEGFPQSGWFWGESIPPSSSFPFKENPTQTAAPAIPAKEEQTTTTSEGPFVFKGWEQQLKFELGSDKSSTKERNISTQKPSLKASAAAVNGTKKRETSSASDSGSLPEFKVFSVGASDILHSLNEEASTSQTSMNDTAKLEKDLFGDIMDDDDEMSIENDFKSPFNFDDPDAFDNDFQQQSPPTKSTKVEVPLGEEQLQSPRRRPSSHAPPDELDREKIHFKAPATANNDASSSSFQVPPFQSQPSSVEIPLLPEELTKDFSEIKIDANFHFNLGAGGGGTSKQQQSKKLGHHHKKKDQPARHTTNSRVSPSNTAMNTSPDVAKASAATSRSTSFPAPVFGSESLAGDQPPAWWGTTASNNGNGMNEQKTPSDQQADANAGKGGGGSYSSPMQKQRQKDLFGDMEDDNDSEEEDEGINPTRQSSSQTGTGQAPPTTPRSAAARAASGEPVESEKSMLSLAELYNKQGKELYSIGLYDRALDAYTKCLNYAPADWIGRATVTGNRAAVNFMMSRYIETVDDCEDALRMDPTLVKLHIRKGKALVRLGHLSPAEAAFNRLIGLVLEELRSVLGDKDAEYTESIEKALSSAKLEAKAGLREVIKLKEVCKSLAMAEGKKEYVEMLKSCDEILHKSPHYRAAIEAKAKALCELSRYEQAKTFMEEATQQTPNNLRVLHAHEQAPVQCPVSGDLLWTEIKNPPSAAVNLPVVKAMMFCMGSELSLTYLHCLKNVAVNRSCSADVMSKILALLELLQRELPPCDMTDGWSWVHRECLKISELLSLKNTADQQFKQKNYRAALNNYSSALKVDPMAKRWAAILFSNRAATQMCLSMYAEAVADCNSAIAQDGDYSRAYLRRARAFRAMNKYNESVKDYRRYLCGDPIPSDFREVQHELEELIEAKNQEQQQQQQRQRNRPTFGHDRHQQQGRPSSGGRGQPGSTRSAYGGATTAEDFANTFGGYSRQGSFRQQQAPPSNQQQQRRSQQAGNNNTGKYSKPSWSNFAEFGFDFMAEDDSDDERFPPFGPASSSTPRNASANNGAEGGATTLFSLKEKDHYTILGVDTAASEREVRMAYRKLALQFHPDKNKENNAEERFKMVSLAYSVLSDKVQRREYDLTRPLSRSSSGRNWY